MGDPDRKPVDSTQEEDVSSRNTEKKHEEHKEPREITIHLHPARIAKFAGVLLVLILVFYAGRFTAGPAQVVVEEPEESALDGFLGVFSGDDASKDGAEGVVTGAVVQDDSSDQGADTQAEQVTEEAVPEEESGEEAAPETQETVDENAGSEETSTQDPPAEEPVITEYNNLELSLDEIYRDWKDTWGKMSGIEFTLTNNEAGTVKPSYFVMIVEGYDESGVKIPVSYKSVKIASGEVHKGTAAIPGGFAYNPATAGNVADIEISLVLFDTAGKSMASDFRTMDLGSDAS